MAEDRRSAGRSGQGSGSGRPRSGGSSGGQGRGQGGGKPRSGGSTSSGKGYGGGSDRPRGGAGGRDGAPRGEGRDGARSGGRDGARTGGREGARDGARGAGGRDGARSGGPKSGSGSYKGGSRDGGKGGAGKGSSYAGRSGAPRGGERRGGERGAFEPEPRTADQAAYDGPDLPPEITGQELDRGVANQLKGLPEKLAARIARHLAAAGIYIDSDPELAYQHAKAAKARAQRLAVIREALGEAAYAAGHYAEALAELRAAKRMNGATAYLPIMADCHRALGHPEQAIKLAHSPSVVNFKPEAKAEMTLVEAGARRDLGQLDAALRVLELSPLTNKTRASWVVRLRYAYADTLDAAGRLNEALTWFHRTHAIDAEDLTDAAARAAELEKRLDEA